jgi:hypothetical protein
LSSSLLSIAIVDEDITGAEDEDVEYLTKAEGIEVVVETENLALILIELVKSFEPETLIVSIIKLKENFSKASESVRSIISIVLSFVKAELSNPFFFLFIGICFSLDIFLDIFDKESS